MTLPHLPPPTPVLPTATPQVEHNVSMPPPPLPPRSLPSPAMQPPPDYSSVMAMSSRDPRSSSTQSLVPDPALDNTGRRRLLLVYIHGFMGNETSFRSFPAHVHNLVSLTLADTHVVHTKIYPRYRARFALEVARDEFSAWLTPHEDQWTDVLLLGHSMGGLLAADIALLFRHRILGIVNFDVPFLGMHPGIIKAGLGSIFKSAPPPEDQLPADAASGKPSRMSTLFNPKPADPNYNPSFHNDVNLPIRKGWENALHWFNKHSNGIREASKGLVKSHLEFGGAMADYRTLKDRYARVRALEEDDEMKRSSANPGVRSPPRIRFVNYYTASTGRPKKPKSPKSPKSPSPSRSGSKSPQHNDGEILRITEHAQEHHGSEAVSAPEEPINSDPSGPNGPPSLPEIPPIPQEPPFVDLMQFTDKNQRRAAEAEYDQAVEIYQKAVKLRNKIINERQDMEEEWEQKKRQQIIEDRMKLEMKWEQERGRLEASSTAKEPTVETPGVEQLEEDIGAMQLGHTSDQGNPQSRTANYEFSTNTIMNQASPDDRSSMHTTTTNDTEVTTPGPDDEDGSKKKKKKLGKFCMLPPNDAYGQKDPTWVRVFMENMDEVAAHTGLFFVNETYERLVGDVGDRIEDWIREADSIRLVREMEGLS